jgi:hypothetical protein
MNEWGVFLAIIVILNFAVTILNNFVRPINKKELDTARVIQQNTDAIKELTKEINTLTVSNVRDHEHFHSSINRLNRDVAVLQEKHRND